MTLCGKNHFGSLVRWPVQQGYYDLHRGSFSKQPKVYREQVDLLGHAHLGGKTVLYLIDGLFPGIHPIDPAPRKWTSPPFNGHWASSLLASQDPVAIDSVGFDFLWTEWEDYPRRAAWTTISTRRPWRSVRPRGRSTIRITPPPSTRLASLGVHEHWNNAEEKKYPATWGPAKGSSW